MLSILKKKSALITVALGTVMAVAAPTMAVARDRDDHGRDNRHFATQQRDVRGHDNHDRGRDRDRGGHDGFRARVYVNNGYGYGSGYASGYANGYNSGYNSGYTNGYYDQYGNWHAYGY